MPTQVVKFDGVDVSEYFATWQESANARLSTMIVPRRHGALVSDAVVQDARQIVVEGRIQETSAENARNTLDTLLALFARQNKPLTLWDDIFINTYKADMAFQYANGSAMTVIDFTITFFCADPFWYGTSGSVFGSPVTPNLTVANTPIDTTNNIYKTTLVVNVAGTYLVYPIWTVRATSGTLKRITIRNTTIGRQWTYTAGVGVTINTNLQVDCSIFTVFNNGVNGLTNWAGDFIWLQPGNNSLEFEGTTDAAYSGTYTIRSY